MVKVSDTVSIAKEEPKVSQDEAGAPKAEPELGPPLQGEGGWGQDAGTSAAVVANRR